MSDSKKVLCVQLNSFCEARTPPITYFKKQYRNMIPWTLALKQFLPNGKEEENCPKYFAVAHAEITGPATPP